MSEMRLQLGAKAYCPNERWTTSILQMHRFFEPASSPMTSKLSILSKVFSTIEISSTPHLHSARYYKFKRPCARQYSSPPAP